MTRSYHRPDALGEKYDAFYKDDANWDVPRLVERAGWPRTRVQAIMAEGGEGHCLLDVGCGNGLLLYQFRSAFHELIGLEVSRTRLERAVLNLSGLRFRPILSSAENMKDIDSATVDQIISADTIEHIPDVYAATKEMFRVLRPGGRLVINTPNIAFAAKRLRLLMGRFPSTSQPNEGIGNDVLFDGGHLHYFTFRSLELLLARAGFRTVKRVGFGRFGVLHHLYPPLLSVGVQVVAEKPA